MAKSKEVEGGISFPTLSNPAGDEQLPEGFQRLGWNIWSPKSKGERLRGLYHGFMMQKSPEGKFDTDEFKSHKFIMCDWETGEPSGEEIQVAGASLDTKLKDAPKDLDCLLIFRGKRELANGRTMNDFDVYAKGL